MNKTNLIFNMDNYKAQGILVVDNASSGKVLTIYSDRVEV